MQIVCLTLFELFEHQKPPPPQWKGLRDLVNPGTGKVPMRERIRGSTRTRWCYLAQVNTHRQTPLNSDALTRRRSCFISIWSPSADNESCSEMNVITHTNTIYFDLFLCIVPRMVAQVTPNILCSSLAHFNHLLICTQASLYTPLHPFLYCYNCLYVCHHWLLAISVSYVFYVCTVCFEMHW